ncbi:restriction endonuclease subunit S [Aeromonas veronii]
MKKQVSMKAPQIRVRGFTDAWQEKTIGKILSEANRSVILEDNEQYELITVKRRNEGVVSRGFLFGRDILVKNYYQLEEGDFVISKRQVVHGATGIVPPELGKAIVSNEYLVVTGNSEISSDFLNIISSLSDMKRKFFLSSYGVDIEKLFFDTEDWKKRAVTIPTLSEQKEITVFFNEINKLIDLSQKKYDKLVTLKQVMLSKMFPQDGASIPDIRFNGFEGVWIEKQFKNLALRVTTTSSAVELPRLEYEDIVSSLGVLNKNVYEKKSMKKGIAFEKNDVLFGKLRPYLKNWLLAAFDGIAVGDFWVLRGIETEPRFLYFLIQTNRFGAVANQSAGSKMPRSDWNLVSNHYHLVPSDMSEQRKIGQFFCKLDELIYQHGIKLVKLREIKEACLSKMFI